MSHACVIAYGDQTSLNDLFDLMISELGVEKVNGKNRKPIYTAFREGDVAHSLAYISKARELLGYCPSVPANEGLKIMLGKKTG